MFTDIVGFSRQMGSDEARTLRLLTAHNQIVEQALLERALELGRKAIALDDSMPLAHELVGMAYL